MKFGSGLAALAAATCILAASPAFAVTAVCTAKDSSGKRYSDSRTGLFDWEAKTIAGALAKANCQGASKHPATCEVVSCKIKPN